MKRFGLKALLGSLVAASVMLFGVAQPASAQQSDPEIIIENVDDALVIVLDGFAAAVDEYLASGSVEAVSHVLYDSFFDAGGALVANTEQFGALGLGFLLVQSAVEATTDPFVGILDNPTLATSLVTPEYVSTVLGNLVPAVEALIQGQETPFFDYPGLIDAAASAIEGNLLAPGIFGGLTTGYAVSDAVQAVANAVYILADLETTPDAIPAGPFSLVGVVALLGPATLDGFVGPQIAQVQTAVQDLLQGPELGTITSGLTNTLRGLKLFR